nr:hypothetical protein [Actinomycetota bacterium]
MGAFYIRRAGTYEAPKEVLRQQGFSAGERLTAGPYAVEVYPRQQDTRPPIQRFEGDDFIAAAGTVLLHSARDTDALEALYAGFTPGEPLGGEAMGMHGLVIRKRGRTFVTADALGAFPIFYSRKTSSVSTSFLALAAEAPRLTVTRQGAAEYVLNGAIVGDDTLVGEIQRLPFGAILNSPPTAPTSISAPSAYLTLTPGHALSSSLTPPSASTVTCRACCPPSTAVCRARSRAA